MSDDWPSHADELTRKVSETLHDLLWRYENGKLSAKQVYVALGALWDTCAGLIKPDMMDLLNQTRLAMKEEINQK